MNDLLNSKKLLENKIALTKGNIERKKREFDRLVKEAAETNEIIVTLHQELWQDEFALDAVNEEISRIPTLAQQKTNPLWKELMMCLAILLLTSFSFGQIGFHVEYSNKYKAGGGIDIGHNFNNVYIGATAHLYFTNKRDVPTEADLVAGYTIGQFQPFISGGYYSCGKEAVSEREGTRGINVGGGLAYQFRDSPVRLSAGVTGNNIFLTVGLFKIL